MKVLLHARLASVVSKYIDVLGRLRIQVDVAETLIDGLARMKSVKYDKIFIGFGVPADDRIAIMQAASDIHQSIIELIDRNTLYKELRVKSLSATWTQGK